MSSTRRSHSVAVDGGAGAAGAGVGVDISAATERGSHRSSQAGKCRRASVTLGGQEREDGSDWTWTTATPSPPPSIPDQDEVWEAVEDDDQYDVDAICEEGVIDVNYRKKAERERTMMSLASECGFATIVKTLLWHKADPNIPDIDGRTPLIEASEYGHLEVVKVLLGQKVELDCQDVLNSRTALTYAARHGWHDVVAALIQAGADVNATTKGGWTALLFAVKWMHISTVRLLLTAKAYVDVADKSGRTPLLYAVQCENLELVEILLNSGAAVRHAAVNGWTALMYATFSRREDVIAYLITAGATVHDENENFETALTVACRHRHKPSVQLLLDHGAVPTRQEATILLDADAIDILKLFKLAPVEDVTIAHLPVQRTDGSATIVLTWKCPYLTMKGHVDIVEKFSIASNPNVGDKDVDVTSGHTVSYTDLEFEQPYCFKVSAKGCRLRSPATRSAVVVVHSHVGTWLRDLGLFEAVYEPVMTFLLSCGCTKAVTISRMTKTMLDEHIPPMLLEAWAETALRDALEKTTCEVLLEESAPLQIHKEDVEVEQWSGLVRRGVWKGGVVTVKKFSKKTITAVRIREMLTDAVRLASMDHPNLVKLRGCCVEPDLGFGYDLPRYPTGMPLSDWCLAHPGLDEYTEMAELSLATAIRCRIVLEAATGLLHLKASGVAHCDLRSSNVYLLKRGPVHAVMASASGPTPQPELVNAAVSEYGLVRPKHRFAKDLEGCKDIELHLPQPPEYASPEQLLDPKQLTYSSDVYSLCILFVELLAGRQGLCWEGCVANGQRESFLFKQWIQANVVPGARPVMPACTPTALKEVVQKGWTRHVAERSTMEEFHAALLQILDHVYGLNCLTTTIVDVNPLPLLAPVSSPASATSYLSPASSKK